MWLKVKKVSSSTNLKHRLSQHLKTPALHLQRQKAGFKFLHPSPSSEEWSPMKRTTSGPSAVCCDPGSLWHQVCVALSFSHVEAWSGTLGATFCKRTLWARVSKSSETGGRSLFHPVAGRREPPDWCVPTAIQQTETNIWPQLRGECWKNSIQSSFQLQRGCWMPNVCPL